MENQTLFFIDASKSDPVSADASQTDFSPMDTSQTLSVNAEFLSLEKKKNPARIGPVDAASRKLDHGVDVAKRVYFGSSAKSLVGASTKARIDASSASSGADLLASLLDAPSSSSALSSLSTSAQLMSKSVITPDFNRRSAVPDAKQSRREKKRAFQQAKEQTMGSKWFDMKRAEMTEEEKRDLKILKMRKALDPKSFYKGDDMKGIPRFFQKGVIVEDKADFYSARIPKKQRKKWLADELLDDTAFVQYGSAKVEEVKKYEEDRKKRLRQKKHLARMSGGKKGKK